MPRSGMPLPGSHFLVDLGDGDAAQGFAEVMFPEFPLAGEAEARLALCRAATGDTRLYDWWDAFRPHPAGWKPAKGREVAAIARLVRVMLLTGDGGEPALTWRFIGAKPLLLQFSGLDANAPAVVFESLTLTFDRLEIN